MGGQCTQTGLAEHKPFLAERESREREIWHASRKIKASMSCSETPTSLIPLRVIRDDGPPFSLRATQRWTPTDMDIAGRCESVNMEVMFSTPPLQCAFGKTAPDQEFDP